MAETQTLGVRRGARCSPVLGTDSKRGHSCCPVWEIVSPQRPQYPSPPHAPHLATAHSLFSSFLPTFACPLTT